MEPKISIIIPVYNAESVIDKCIESVLGQTYHNLEIICINDGSTDFSPQKILNYSIRDSRIRLINQSNCGVSATRNRGIKEASGEFIMFLDSDDWIDNETCEYAITVALKNKADVVFWNYIREFDKESKRTTLFTENQIKFEHDKLDDLQRRFIGLYGKELEYPQNADSLSPVWGKLYRNTCFNEEISFVNTAEIGTSEDALFNLAVFENVSCAIYINQYFNHYRKENGSSFTKGYKPKLWEQWNRLFDYLEGFIVANEKNETYRIALSNRISLGIIGLGMNILRGDSYNYKKLLREVLASNRYRVAISELEMKWFPIYWKIFFYLAKWKNSVGVLCMLKCIKFIKGDRTGKR